ncbi:MAG TPA: retroviral-like aspartic protease family protein [Vicinamibacterales bacterium]|nr:retroviral-like aspartic protease family protein [Vicinamibacterales bacterium]
MRISTAIATLLLSALPAAAGAGDTAVTPIDLLEDGSLVVPVTINGAGPYRFVLDTGSSRTVISTRLAVILRLQTLSASMMVTPSGRTAALIVRLDGLAIGGRPAVNVSAAVAPHNRYAAGQAVDGLIGQDVLGHAVYTIDYQRRTVTWHEPGDTLRGLRLALNVRNNRVLVILPQRDGDPRPLSFIPDTGSDGLVVFAHAKDRFGLTLLDVGLLSSVTGSRLVRRVQLETLVVGDTRLEQPFAVLVDNPESPELMGDGLLPLHIFSRVTFNVAEGYLIIEGR